jgi:ferredoxin
VGQPLDLGDTPQGHRRIVPLTGGAFTGPRISGTLVPGVSADWQIVLPDGTALGDIRYTLQTDNGALLYVRSQSIRHGSPEVLARLGRGDDVDASEYTFRTATQIETGSPELNWLNKGVFVSSDYHTLLELAESCDVPVRWSCRTGVCQTCETTLIAGDVDYRLDPVEPPATGSVFICCSQPRDDIVLDL